MTYVLEVRIKNPDHDANLLLQNTYKLNDRIYRSFIISSAVLHGAICQLMRYCWHTEGFCDPYQRDDTTEAYERCVMKLPSLETNALNSALAELKVIFGPAKGEQLQNFCNYVKQELRMTPRGSRGTPSPAGTTREERNTTQRLPRCSSRRPWKNTGFQARARRLGESHSRYCHATGPKLDRRTISSP
jgi:hypothetical protein